MRRYIIQSLETHLFFGRIMKEHALFIQAAFPAKETNYIKRADWFRREFEKLLKEVVDAANGMVGEIVLVSGEIVTEFTALAEQQTSALSGISIDTGITEAEERLQAGVGSCLTREQMQLVRMMNQRVLRLLSGLIGLKEEILQEVLACRLYTANYPLLIQHILREARLYRQILSELEQKGGISAGDMKKTEIFWNQIMMEHAWFIRGLLDPSECRLIETADTFAKDFCRLLEEAKKQENRAMDHLTRVTLETMEPYRDFKAAGTKGITGCTIRSVILPLLADHVLREANHYLRILNSDIQITAESAKRYGRRVNFCMKSLEF